VLSEFNKKEITCLDDVFEADRIAREFVKNRIS